MYVLDVTHLMQSMRTCCQLVGHLSKKYLIVNASVLRGVVHSKAQVLVGSQLDGAHRLVS